MKICKKCGFKKDLVEFSKNKRKTDGLDPWCKVCVKEHCKIWRSKNTYDGRATKEKLCYVCNIVKQAEYFYNDKSRIDGLSNDCKICHKERANNNKEKRSIIFKQYYNKIKVQEKPKLDGKICSKCKEYKKESEYDKTIYTSHGFFPQCKKCQKESDFENSNKPIDPKKIERRKVTSSIYFKNKRKNDPIFRLRTNTALAVRMAVFNYSSCFFSEHFKSFTKELFNNLPYTPDQLKNHIESLWEPWMSWDNYGKYDKTKLTWQIDHIIPQSKLPFNSFNDSNFKLCWSLENLRPLETMDNKRKSNKIIPSLLKKEVLEKYTKTNVNNHLHKSVSE